VRNWSWWNLRSHRGAAHLLISDLSNAASNWVEFSGCGTMKKSSVAGSSEACAGCASRHLPQASAEGVLPCMILPILSIMRVQVQASTRLLRNAMFHGNVYYCWFCDAHRRGIPGVAGTKICPRCQKDLSESSRVTAQVTPGSGEPERRPIFALSIGHPAANSAPAWTGNVAAAS
jgi:hypothetical protein